MESLMTGGGNDAALFWTAMVAATMIIGLLGVVIPVLPGLMLIWGAAFVYGLILGFGTGGIAVMVILSVLAVISVIKSVVIPRRAAAGSGASGWSQLGAVAGGVIGFFVIPVVGLIIGALAGLLAVEFLLKGNWADAWTSTKMTARGFGVSAIIDFGLGMAMILAWSVWATTVIF